MAKFYIVWNAGRNEGFVTDDKADAEAVASGKFPTTTTAAGADFFHHYSDEDLTLEEVNL